MSRSFKKRPFQAVCGGGSAKHDKALAARGVRRANRIAINTCPDFEDFIPPHRYECSWNNTYSWGRDGRQMWNGLDARDWFRYQEALAEGRLPKVGYWYDCYGVWPPKWYAEMMRK